jgi:hypothetical protein
MAFHHALRRGQRGIPFALVRAFLGEVEQIMEAGLFRFIESAGVNDDVTCR